MHHVVTYVVVILLLVHMEQSVKVDGKVYVRPVERWHALSNKRAVDPVLPDGLPLADLRLC